MAKPSLQSSMNAVAGQPAGIGGDVASNAVGIGTMQPPVVSPLWRLVLRGASPITPFNEAGLDPPIFCLHSISGEVTSMTAFANALAPGQRFYGIQVPKADMKPALVATIPDIARRHVEALVAFKPDGPLVLAGWSAGAVIALEMAVQLRARGRDVPLLIALDGAPCNTGAGIRRYNPLYFLKLLYNLPGWITCEFDQGVSARILLQRMKERLIFRARTALPKLVNEQTLNGSAVQRVLDFSGWLSEDTAFVRALHNATRSYVAKPYSGNVLVYEAKTQPLDHLTQIGAAWRQVAPHATIVRMNGNHGSMLRNRNVHVLAADLMRRMAPLRGGGDQGIPSKG